MERRGLEIAGEEEADYPPEHVMEEIDEDAIPIQTLEL